MATPTLAAFATQAITLRGVVVSDEMGGPPLPNVALQVSGSPEVYSDELGRFAIPLSNGMPGDSVRIQVKLKGFVPVSPALLDVTLSHDESSPSISIPLTREAVWEEVARQFYTQACVLAVPARAHQPVNGHALTAHSPADRPVLNGKDRDLVLRAKDSWGKLFSQVPAEAMSNQHREALNRFLNGRTQSALDILANTPFEAALQGSEVEKLQAVQSCLLQARILITQFRFSQARALHRTALTWAPDSLAAWYSLALLEQALHQHEDSRKAFHRALELARKSRSPEPIAEVLEGLGHLHREQERFEDARRSWQECLALRRTLASDAPERYLPRVAASLNDLATLNLDLGNPIPARAAFQEALEIYRTLAAQHPRAFIPFVASIHSNMGALSAAEGKADEGRRHLEEAIQVQRDLAALNPAQHRSSLARSLFNLALLEHRQKRLRSAEAAYSDALGLFRILAEEQTTTYIADVADCLNNLGILFRELNRPQEALHSLQAALAAYREAAAEHPERFRRTIDRLEVRIRELASPVPAPAR